MHTHTTFSPFFSLSSMIIKIFEFVFKKYKFHPNLHWRNQALNKYRGTYHSALERPGLNKHLNWIKIKLSEFF